MAKAWKTQLAEDGYVVVPAVIAAEHVDAILAGLAQAFDDDVDGSTLRSVDGSIYGARNLLQLWPPVIHAWRRPPLPEILADVLGPQFGLVRVLYFDKPPEQSWALPWHKDMAIAVQNNRLSSKQFGKPTFKVGVPHVEAPAWLLENMLTLRLHLDDMTEENGPLQVMPGSHQIGTPAGSGSRMPVTILGERGAVLLIRPLVSHCSNESHPETKRHRRILHYEFSGVEHLPDGFAWHDFIRCEKKPR